MSESVFIGRSAKGYTSTPELPKYTKVCINVDDDSCYEAGSGDNVLELDCPWGSQQMANDILESIGEFVYRPYDTEWAKLDPAAELGDGVTINGVFSGIYVNETNFSTLMAARIAAPQENAVDHEYPYKSPTDRKTTRQFAETRASLNVNAASIQAEVTARKKSDAEFRSALLMNADSISAEVSARTKGETEMKSSIKLNADSIAAEIEARTSGETEMKFSIKMNADSLAAEITARKTGESEMRTSIKANTDSISAEVTARKNGESQMRSTLELHTKEIAARVTQSGGSSSSFGWSLTANGFLLQSSGKTVFQATKNGVDITGKITATSGYIGTKTNGFTITEKAIYNKLSSLYGTVNGIYIGADGIALGGGKFRVNSYGKLYATDGTFTGNVFANRIQTGTQNGEYAGYISGGQIGGGTITSANTNNWINTGLANGYDFSDFSTGALSIGYAKAGYVKAGTLVFQNYYSFWDTITDKSGVQHIVLKRGSRT